MFHLLGLAVAFAQSSGQIHIAPPKSRFQYESPLTSIPGLTCDDYNDGMGLAQQWARAHQRQARILWIDGTANLERINSEAKIEELVSKIAAVGFNTIVFDIKPISGQVLYKSAIEPKLASWKGQTLPLDFDPLPPMIRAAHAHGLTLLVSMNAFSEGHSLFEVGPGYDMPEHQSVLYQAVPMIRSGDGDTTNLNPKVNATPGKDAELSVYGGKTVASDLGHAFWVSLGPDGWPMASGVGGEPDIPENGFVLAGIGSGAEFLESHRDQRLQIDSRAEFVRTGVKPEQYPLMMDPNDPEVQSRELSIVQEVASHYPVDGILYDDRLRFAGMDADFSELSRSLFESYVGAKLNWPDDVYKVTYSSTLHQGIRPGKYYDAWMVWRALQIRNWIARVRNTVKAIRPNALFGIYGGAWYGDYPKFGTNYAGPKVQAGFWFLTPPYAKTGFANLLDLFISGCYYDTASIYQAMEEGKSIGATIESAGQLSNRLVDDQCWTIAGISLDVGEDPVRLEQALQAACASTQGVMVFDLSHDIEPQWPVFAQAFKLKALPPYRDPDLLARVRALRKQYRKLGAHETPIVISAGSSGTGF